jgi:hypothetical protein
MYAMRTLLITILALLVACPGNSVLAMSSSNYAIPSDSFNGGGGDTSASANYKILDTAGQTVAGAGSSADFIAQQGYRTGAGAAAGVLSVVFVDGAGATIASPVVSFTGITAGTTSANGVLGTASSKVRITNTRSIAPWSLTIAATAGPSGSWSNGTNTMSFDQPGSGSALTIDPTSGAVTAVNAPCTTAGLTLGSLATFNQGVVDSITLLTAGAGADTACAWDMTGANLTQTVPASQPAGSYSIPMTITVS